MKGRKTTKTEEIKEKERQGKRKIEDKKEKNG